LQSLNFSAKYPQNTRAEEQMPFIEINLFIWGDD
jgi:hypothetical protein